MQVLLAPQISEKATWVADKNEQVIFVSRPMRPSRKIKAAVELLFRCRSRLFRSPLSGQAKAFGRSMGRRKNWKKPSSA